MDASTPPPHRLVLGSASPRRAALLTQLGLRFEQIVSPEPEPEPADHAPADYVGHAAAAKAAAVGRLTGMADDTVIIGADTVVVLGQDILGKPRDRQDAAAMLARLAGRTHAVYTGVCLRRGAGLQLVGVEVTRVHMRPLPPRDIDWYVASGEPLDKAGAYGIQGLGARFIERIEGCYYNVVGLPLARLCALLEQAGHRFVQPTSS